MQLVLLSPEEDLPNEVEVVRWAFDKGLSYYHLRKPKWDQSRVRRFLKELGVEYSSKLVLHKRIDWANSLGLSRIHLGDGQFLNGDRLTASKSFHFLEDLEFSKEDLEYAFLSPIFDSISKPGYGRAFAEERISSFFKRRALDKFKSYPVFALGGVDEKSLIQAKQMGFDGVAILGAVWLSDTPKDVLERLINLCERN